MTEQVKWLCSTCKDFTIWELEDYTADKQFNEYEVWMCTKCFNSHFKPI